MAEFKVLIGGSMRRLKTFCGFALCLQGLNPTSASAQVSFAIDNGDGPLILCDTFDPDALVRYSTGQVPNNPKAAKRFRYHFEKWKTETGSKLSGGCETFTALADSYALQIVPGPGFTNLNGQHVSVVLFSWLPADWATRPVPGEDEDDTKKKDDNATEPRGIAISFKVPKSYAAEQKGFVLAKADLQYAFIACFGELHIAYAVLPKSVRLGSKRYQMNGERFDVDVKPPTLSAISLHVRVSQGLTDYVEFDDAYAADALGFGCFSSQSHKVAQVKKLFGTATPTRNQIEQWADNVTVDAWANETLTSADAESQILEQVRNKRLEASKEAEANAADGKTVDALDERFGAEGETRAAQKAAEEAEFQAKQKAYEEGMAAHKAAVEQYQKALTDNEAQKAANVAQANAAREAFARKQAEYEAEVARARQAQAEYEARVRKPR